MNGQSMIKMDKQRKLKMAIGRVAIMLAKNNNDTLYEKYKMHRDAMLELKAKIIEKYGPKAAQIIKKSMSK